MTTGARHPFNRVIPGPECVGEGRLPCWCHADQQPAGWTCSHCGCTTTDTGNSGPGHGQNDTGKTRPFAVEVRSGAGRLLLTATGRSAHGGTGVAVWWQGDEYNAAGGRQKAREVEVLWVKG